MNPASIFPKHLKLLCILRDDGMSHAVSVQLAGEPDGVRLFHTRDQAEAEAVAQLANEKLTTG